MRRYLGLHALLRGGYTTVPLTEVFVTVDVYELSYPIVFLLVGFSPSCHLNLQACLIYCLLSYYLRCLSELQLLRVLLPHDLLCDLKCFLPGVVELHFSPWNYIWFPEYHLCQRFDL